MRTRLSIFCDKVIEAGWLAALVIVPLFFNIYSQRVFEPDKLSLLRSIALVMAVAWLIRIVEDWRIRQTDSLPPEPKVPLWKRIYKTPLVLPTLLLVLVYLISTPLSLVPLVSLVGSYQRLQGTYTTLSYIVIFFLALEGIRTKRQLSRVITVTILVSFPIAMYGLIQHFGLDPLPWGGNVTTRVASNMGNAIFVAAFLIMVTPLTISRLLENWKEAVGEFDVRSGVLGVIAFILLVGALLAGMLLRVGKDTLWVRWAALLIGIALQVPIYLLSPADRRARVLTISLPLTFAFLVGFSWILEIFFPPATANYFWLGLLAALIFVLAMAAFAYYLRKPVARLMLLAAYFVILIAQIVCIFYTQSRGPLLGLLGGMFFYIALLGLLKRQIWLPWLMSAGAIAVAVFLIMFNTIEADWMDKLRETPYVGRLGRVLETESGTGKVRVLIWEGVVEMVDWHNPLEYPGQEGGPDAINALRPLVGYGPESMYVGYNRFYPPDLAHYEKRNASPDRSHNETFDSLVITGGVGFIVYILVFTSVFYFGLKWLGLIRTRWQSYTFLGLWALGGIAGTIVTWAWRGPVYVGVGIPGGLIVGFAAYVFLGVLVATLKRDTQEPLGGRYSLWMLALVSAMVAHFIEIHFGIAIAATRTYFWMFAAMMVVIGIRLALQPSEADMASADTDDDAEEEQQPSRRRRRRGTTATSQARPQTIGASDWQGSILVYSIVAVLLLSTMLFDYITIQQGDPGTLATIWQSLTMSKGNPTPVMLTLVAVTWVTFGLVSMSELATRKESKGRDRSDWLSAIGIFALITFGGALIFALLHTTRLKPVTISSIDAPNPLTHTITFYYVWVVGIILALAAVMAFMFRRSIKSVRWSGELADIGVIGLTVVLPIVAAILVFTSNVSIVRADILYKQGLSSENSKQLDGAIYFYDKAIEMAKKQDFYYLFLGRAYMEKGKSSKGEERETWLQESENALLKARDIAPLNTDHSANLARLYRTWGGLSQGERRSDLLNRALTYYADATNLSPNNAQLFNEWGQTYYILGDQERALEMYEKSWDLDQEYVQTYLLLGEFYMQQKEWDKAVEAYQKAAEIEPESVDAYSALGFVYTQIEDTESALEAYRKAVEIRPSNFNNRKNLAILYQQMGLFDEAIIEASQALELAPEDQKQTMQSFLAQLQQAVGGGDASGEQIQLLLDAGQQQMDAEDWDTAAATFQQILGLSPNNPQAHSALAYIYAKQGRTDEAITENLAVASLVPSDYNSYKNLALLYQQKGDIAKAISAIEQAMTLAPESEQAALQAFLEQLRQLQGDSPPAATDQKASELLPMERNNMFSAPPAMQIDPTKAYQATIVTAKGNIVIDLAVAEAPQTVNNLVFLSQQGYYNNLTFHRVENSPGFSLIQGGDPTGTGRGGPGYTVPAEIGLPHEIGAIATARTGDQVNPERASSGSQFYICLEPIHQLDGAYTVFGYVSEGLDVAGEIQPGDEILTIVITEQ